MDKMNGMKTISVDSCSTSSGCVSDLDNLSSEERSPDSPLSSTDSLLCLSTNSELNSLPNEIILIRKEVLENEELIESEIVIDCSLNENNVIPVEDLHHCFYESNNSEMDCSSSVSEKSDSTGSGLESDHKSCLLLTNDNSSSNSNNSLFSSYFCKWTHCDWPGNYDDLVDHIREIHVELQPYHHKHNWKKHNNSNEWTLNESSVKNNYNAQQYVCLWEGCKVYGKGSLSRNWLERHVLEQHSGPRPFKCIVERCGARFKVQSALERHVNSHFKPNVDFRDCDAAVLETQQSLPNNNCSDFNSLTPFELHLQQTSRATMMRCKIIELNNNTNINYCSKFGSNIINNCQSNNLTPNKILKRKKSATKIRKKCIIVAKCSEDFFDECVMEQVRYGLIQLNARTGLDINGTQSTITFQSKVIARRENDSGEVNVLLKWEPNNILPDVWVKECEAIEMKSKTIPVSLLPHECLQQLIETESKPKIKQRRK